MCCLPYSGHCVFLKRVENLTEEFVTNEAEVLELINRGEQQRSTSSTGMNETSSRSHSLFVLTGTVILCFFEESLTRFHR